jgi:hypothetical protein
VSVVTNRPFNLVVAFERDDDAHGNTLGRAVAESSFHHFVDYNWDTREGLPELSRGAARRPDKARAREARRREDLRAQPRALARPTHALEQVSVE